MAGRVGGQAPSGLLKLTFAAAAVPAFGLVPGNGDVHEALKEVALLLLGRAPDILDDLVGLVVLAALDEVKPASVARVDHALGCTRFSQRNGRLPSLPAPRLRFGGRVPPLEPRHLPRCDSAPDAVAHALSSRAYVGAGGELRQLNPGYLNPGGPGGVYKRTLPLLTYA